MIAGRCVDRGGKERWPLLVGRSGRHDSKANSSVEPMDHSTTHEPHLIRVLCLGTMYECHCACTAINTHFLRAPRTLHRPGEL